jgi:peptidoglycan/xylan/chitin deacetylase (PgdA/CDA1 family)
LKKRRDLRVQLPSWLTTLFPDAVWQLPSEDKVVYLTFDDGPVPEVTPQVLDILHKYKVEATFFCVGENVLKHPELFQQIREEGHAVGNHTHNHLQGIKTTNKAFFQNIEQANQLIGSNMFRPPHGWLKRSQYHTIKKRYSIVMWDVISCDYDRTLTPEHCFCNVVDFVRDGSIITFHDSIKAQKNILGALPRVIEYLLEQGYTFKKIEIPKTRPLISTPWQRQLQELRENITKRLKWA